MVSEYSGVNQCCSNAGPASPTLGQHLNSTGPAHCHLLPLIWVLFARYQLGRVGGVFPQYTRRAAGHVWTPLSRPPPHSYRCYRADSRRVTSSRNTPSQPITQPFTIRQQGISSKPSHRVNSIIIVKPIKLFTYSNEIYSTYMRLFCAYI